MTPSSVLPLAGAASALFLATFVVTATPIAASTPQAPAQESGDALVMRMCNECHDARTVTARRRTKGEWEASLRDMIQEGAEGTGKEFEAVFDYLLLTRGKVFMNMATPEDLVQVFGLTKKDAEAIVSYRKEKGPFADLDAVRKVPGIDLKLIDAQPDAATF